MRKRTSESYVKSWWLAAGSFAIEMFVIHIAKVSRTARFLRKVHIGILFVGSLLLVPAQVALAVQDNTWLESTVSVQFQNESRENVLKKVAQQSGISIIYDQELANEKIAGSFNNVTIADAINRLFRGKNKIIQVSNRDHTIIVKTFGSQNFIMASSDEHSGQIIEPMTLAQIEALHSTQYKEYKERIANENEVLEEGGGITRGELMAMQKEQYSVYKRHLTDDLRILEGSGGVTQAELRATQEKQYSEYQAAVANSDTVLEGGVTQGEIHAQHQEQYQAFLAQKINGNEILEGGMTRRELHEMHEQQYLMYKEKLKDNSSIPQ